MARHVQSGELSRSRVCVTDRLEGAPGVVKYSQTEEKEIELECGKE